jgi:hypothetical protein
MPKEIEVAALLLLTAIMGVVVLVYIYLIFRSLRILKWLKTKGDLIDFYIEESDGGIDSGNIYTPYVRYRYTVGKSTYISDKLGFGLWGSSFSSISEHSLAKAFIEPLPVYYDPSDVSTAILIRGFTLHHFLCLLILSGTFGIMFYMCRIYL